MSDIQQQLWSEIARELRHLDLMWRLWCTVAPWGEKRKYEGA